MFKAGLCRRSSFKHMAGTPNVPNWQGPAHPGGRLNTLYHDPSLSVHKCQWSPNSRLAWRSAPAVLRWPGEVRWAGTCPSEDPKAQAALGAQSFEEIPRTGVWEKHHQVWENQQFEQLEQGRRKKTSVSMNQSCALHHGWEHCPFLYYFITLSNFHLS
jgi:hypothetical protein